MWYRVPYCLPTKSKLSLLKYELWTFQWIICYITLVCQLLASLIYQHIFLARGRGALLLGMVAFGTNLSVKLWGGNSYHLIVQYIVYFKKDFGLLIQHVVFIFVFFVGVGEQPLFHWWGDCLIMYLINWLIKYFKTDCYLFSSLVFSCSFKDLAWNSALTSCMITDYMQRNT